jgi:hypothetical protein
MIAEYFGLTGLAVFYEMLIKRFAVEDQISK